MHCNMCYDQDKLTDAIAKDIQDAEKCLEEAEYPTVLENMDKDNS